MSRSIVRGSPHVTAVALWLGLPAWIGCRPDSTPRESASELPDESGAPDTGTGPCAQPVALTPAASTVAAYGFVQLQASGGTGEYSFSLSADSSGATVNERSGAYVAGGTSGGTDEIAVKDQGCDGGATAAVQVVDDLAVAPPSALVPPGTALTVLAQGGSGLVSCALDQDASGASLGEGCAYTAGPGEGTDILRVRDEAIGQYADVVVTVDADAALRVQGYGHLYLPVGARFAPVAAGGSGALTLTVLEGDLLAEDGAIVAGAAGEGRVRVADTYADLSVEIPVTVVAARGPELPRDGEGSNEGDAVALGDLDGDGDVEAALGFVEWSVDHDYGGAVAIYDGAPGGLEPEPVQVLAGAATFETFGRAVAGADVDQDGLTDLIVGADRLDYGDLNVGAVHLFAGQGDGTFSDAPVRTLYGQLSTERLGASVAALDLDGDGWIDLALGAVDGADDTVAEPADEQGAIHVFRGSADGYGDKADFVLYGVVPDADGAWQGQADAHVSTAMVAGDLDGDGLAELVAGGPDGGQEEASGDGVVLFWQGTLEDDLLLSREPIGLLVDPLAHEGELGRRLAIGDIDGDGAQDLAVAQPGYDGAHDDEGAAHVWVDLKLDRLSATSPLHTEDADWRVSGANDDDQLGSDLDLVDLDGDGAAELVVGASRVNGPDTTNDGAVYVFGGDAVSAGGALFDPEDGAQLSVAGPSAKGRFGQALAGLAPAGGGAASLLVLAGTDSAYGIEAGAPWVAPLDGGAPSLLAAPGEAAGHAIGTGLLWLDLDADWLPELLVGAPDAGDEDHGGNAGVLVSYPGTADGAAEEGAQILGDHPTASSSDRFGYALARTDFDGDGYDDLAVAARRDARPSSFDEDEFANPDECPGSVSYAGSVHIYRGGPDGIGESPAFAWFGDTASGLVTHLAGGLDQDGDGDQELVVASESWGDGGGFAVLRGRVADPDGITVLCDAVPWLAAEEFDRLGASLAALGDLDGDGCDELAIGATGEELDDDWSNQGLVRVLWGWGGAACPATPELSTAALAIVGTGLGSALAGGGDVDGDGILDLVVGASTYRAELSEVGAVWVVPGSHVLTWAREPVDEGSLPDDDAVSASVLLPELGLDEQLGVPGALAGGLFGAAVALVPDPVDPARAAVAVGAPQGDWGGEALGGGVAIYRWRDDTDPVGLESVPWAVLGGESFAPEGALGAALWADPALNPSWLLVGAPSSSALGLEVGAAYLVPLD